MAVLRVLQVFTIMNRGGAESMVMNYYRKIDRTKVQFDFLVHRKEKAAFDDEIDRLGGNIYKMDPINPLMPSKYYEELRDFFKENNQYLIIHSHINSFSSFPLKIAKEVNVPYRIAHAHIAINKESLKDFFLTDESLKEKIKKIIKRRLRKRINKYVTHRFSCGEKAGFWIFGKNNEFEIINNAIHTEKFVYNSVVSSAYKKENGLEKDIVIGHIGRFNSQKNHSFLLKVFKEVLKVRENYKLVLVGEGDLMEVVKNESETLSIKEKVIFLGAREDVANLYQMFDLFVFPSFYEGLPVVLIESQASGLKIFASDSITDKVSLTEDIEFLSIKKDPKYWAKKILEIGDYDRKNNFNEIKNKRYDINSNAEKLQEFYLTSVASFLKSDRN